MTRLELKVPPALVTLITVLLMWGVRELLPRLTVTVPGTRRAAVVLLAAGAALGVLGVWEFRRARTTVNPHRVKNASSLVVSGIYGVSRNPMYLAMLIALAAAALWLSNVATLAGLPAYVAYLNRFQIEPEERAMEERFGDIYHEYAAQVRRWI